MNIIIIKESNKRGLLGWGKMEDKPDVFSMGVLGDSDALAS